MFENFQIVAVKTNPSGTKIGSLYPNPARDQFSFNYNQLKEDLHLSIYSAVGALVKEYFYTDISNAGKITVQGLQMPNGLYFIHFKDGEHHQMRKMIIQNN